MDDMEEESSAQAVSPGVGLALGGGVVYTAAGIGVFRVLEEAGVPIVAVAGTSGGAFVGAGIAAGLSSADLEATVAKMSWRDLVRFSPNSMGIFNASRMAEFAERYTGCRFIEDLRLPLSVVCADIDTGDEIRLKKGPLGPAIQASSSIPGLFQPVRLEGRTLVDGGIVDNLPVPALSEFSPAVTLGVDVLTKSGPYQWRLRSGAHLVLRAYHTMVKRMLELQDRRADFIVTPDVVGLSVLNFRGYAELVKRGERAAREILPALQGLLADRMPPVRPAGENPPGS